MTHLNKDGKECKIYANKKLAKKYNMEIIKGII